MSAVKQANLGHLSASGIRVSLGGNEILHGIDADFRPGLVHGVLGPNGCGKTTLLRTICGVLKPEAGQVTLDGVAVNEISPAALARKMAVVWQGGTAPADITVKRLVGHGRYAHLPWWQLNPPNHDEAIVRAMERTGITQWANRRVATLSGGERQRVWIATALAQEPDVLLLDEPTTYLDIAHQLDILELIKQLNADTGLTVVTVLHDLTQAARYCDRIKVMNAGQIRREGSPQEVLAADAVAADFEVDAWVVNDPLTNQPLIAPRQRIADPSAS